MKIQRWRGAFVALFGLSLMAICRTPAAAQISPAALDKTRLVPNARSQAMGGVNLTLLDDAGAAVFNPALLADAGRSSVSIQASARNNIPYWDALDFINDLNKTADQIRNDPTNVDWNAVGQRLNDLYNFADKITDTIVAGKPVAGGISLSPNVALSYKNVGVIAYGGVAGVALLTKGTGTGPFDDKRTLEASAGFLDLLTVGVPYAFRVGNGSMGVTAKYIRSDYTGVAFIADASNRSLTGRQYRRVHDAQPDLDWGYRTDARPLSPGSRTNYQVAGALRNLLSPKFRLAAIIKKETTIGGEAPPPSDFTYALRPAADIGGNLTGTFGGKTAWRAALELHNLTRVNGGDVGFHAGGEIVPIRGLAVRGGYNQDQFVFGFGAALGPIRVDAAAGRDWRKLLSAGVSARF